MLARLQVANLTVVVTSITEGLAACIPQKPSIQLGSVELLPLPHPRVGRVAPESIHTEQLTLLTAHVLQRVLTGR